MIKIWINKFQGILNLVKQTIERHTFISAILLNSVFLMLVLVFCEIKYETSDDYIMAAIMSGAYSGTPNPHMIYINIIWGYILLPFYYFIPQLSWYLVSQLIVCFFSFTAITYVLLKRLDTILALMLSTLFITFFSDDVYIMVQFTKTAIVAVMAGSVLFLTALFHEKNHGIKQIIFGGCLVFTGTLIRFNVIYIAGGFILLILVTEFIGMICNRNKWSWKKFGQITAAGIILITAVIGAKELDEFIYNTDESYAYFRAYGNVRGNIVDKRDYGYEVCAEEFQKMGISKNDYTLFRTWNFADPDFFTLETMEKVREIISNYQAKQGVDRDSVKYDLRSRNYWAYPSLWGCVILLLLCIVFVKRYWIVLLMSGVGGYLYLYYFAASGKIVYRIEYAVLFCVFLTGIYFFEKSNCRKVQNQLELHNICVILIMLLCIYQAPTYRLNQWAEWINGEEYKNYIEDNFFNSWDYDSRRYRCSAYNNKAFSGLSEEITKNSDNFYFLNFSTTIQTLYLAENPRCDERNSLWKNSYYLSGITVNFPDVLNLLKSNKVENPIKSLLDENVYLIDNFYPEEILIYIQEHYYPDARKELYKTIDGFQIWKYYTN